MSALGVDDSDASPPLPIPSRDSLDSLRLGRSTSSRRHKDGDRYSTLSVRDLVKLLLRDDLEKKELQRTLHTLTSQLASETSRALSAERQTHAALSRIQRLTAEKASSQQEAAQAKEELRLYKAQLDAAQKEIARAQRVVEEVEAQRYEAEERAAKARSRAREWREDRLVERAREEGRREGVRIGLGRGRGVEERTTLMLGSMGEEDEGTPRPPAHQPIPDFTVPETPRMPSRTPEHKPQPPLPPQPAPPSLSGTSPRYQDRDRLPDGYVPIMDGDNMIRLPPPHELGASPGGHPPPPLEEEIRIIPPPTAQSDSNASRRHRRRSSLESESQSQSTMSLSQLDILSAPSRPSRDRRSAALSAIPEVRSMSGTPSGSQQQRNATPGPSTNPMPMPAPISLPFPQPAGPPLSRSQSAAGLGRKTPTPADRTNELSRSSSDSSRVPQITIQPPSRPASNKSNPQTPNPTTHGLLSPEDAHRPLPPVDEDEDDYATAAQPAFVPPAGTPLFQAPDGQLPAGFVPLGRMVPTPQGQGGQLSPGLDVYVNANDPGAGVYEEGGGGEYQEEAGAGEGEWTSPVIPPGAHIPNVNVGVYGGATHYTRPGSRSSSSSSPSSDAGSLDTLTTPPGRRRGTGSSLTAAGVALPASTVGGSEPSGDGAGAPRRLSDLTERSLRLGAWGS